MSCTNISAKPETASSATRPVTLGTHATLSHGDSRHIYTQVASQNTRGTSTAQKSQELSWWKIPASYNVNETPDASGSLKQPTYKNTHRSCATSWSIGGSSLSTIKCPKLAFNSKSPVLLQPEVHLPWPHDLVILSLFFIFVILTYRQVASPVTCNVNDLTRKTYV